LFHLESRLSSAHLSSVCQWSVDLG
jgi:hypothetical protein